jgi:hypothetical protein
MTESDFILKCREVRDFLIANPGRTSTEVLKHVKGSTGCLTKLSRMGVAFWKKEGDEPARWFPRAMPNMKPYPVKADLSSEDEMYQDESIKDDEE